MKFQFLNGPDGEQSSKRLFSFILVLLYVILFFANLFWGKALKASVEDNLFYLILVMYAGVSLEGWKKAFFKDDSEKTKA